MGSRAIAAAGATAIGCASALALIVWRGDDAPRAATSDREQVEAGAASAHPPPPQPSMARPRIPNVTLTTHDGEQVAFYDDLVKGKIVVINFMYSTCTGT